MRYRANLKAPDVVRLPGFKNPEVMGAGESRCWYLTGSGIRIRFSEERWYADLSDMSQPVPAVLEGFVEDFSFRDTVRFHPAREAGIYRFNKAEAELEAADPESGFAVVLIKATRIEDLRELFRQIRLGKIRPTESYEGSQTGMSREELEAELERVRTANQNLKDDLGRIRIARNTFKRGWWPLFSSSRVVQLVVEIGLALAPRK